MTEFEKSGIWSAIDTWQSSGDADSAAGGFREWSTGDGDAVQSHLAHAGRYSRFVDIMKIALPLAAFAILVIVILTSVMSRDPERFIFELPNISVLEDDLYMLKPKITGFDAKNRPYMLTAETAVQDRIDTDLVHLDTIEGQLMSADDTATEDTPIMALSAANGLLDKKSQRLTVRGDVNIASRSDYRLNTEEAEIDFDANQITSEEPVQAWGPKGRVTSDAMTVLDGGDTVIFRGNVKTFIDPKQDKAHSEGPNLSGGAVAQTGRP